MKLPLVVPLVLALSGTCIAATPASDEPIVKVEVVAPVEVAVQVKTVVHIDASIPVDAAVDDESCGEAFTPVDGDVLLASNAVSAAPCKSCKDRTWCKCSYNGLPRVSCNPCCYGHLGIPQTCFD